MKLLLSKPADNQRIEAIHVQPRLAGLVQLSEQVEPVAFQPTGSFKCYLKVLFGTDFPVALANEFAHPTVSLMGIIQPDLKEDLAFSVHQAEVGVSLRDIAAYVDVHWS